MINWRSGIAGFKGASKYLIKGFFSYAYSATSDDPIQPDAPFGVSVRGIISGNGEAVAGLILSSFAIAGNIDPDGAGVHGFIDINGEAVAGEITTSLGVQGTINEGVT